VLIYASCVVSTEDKQHNELWSKSLLISIKAGELGLLQHRQAVRLFEAGQEEEIVSFLREKAKEIPSKSEEIQTLSRFIERFKPQFRPNTLTMLRLITTRTYQPETRERRISRFDWKESLFPILSAAASSGFKLTRTIGISSEPITVPSLTEAQYMTEDEVSNLFLSLKRIVGGLVIYELNWKECRMMVFPTLGILRSIGTVGEGEANQYIDSIFDLAPELSGKKNFALWVIDDGDALSENSLKHWINKAHQKSKGLKHRLIFQCTPASEVQNLLIFLLSAGRKGTRQQMQSNILESHKTA
jgi:hypothetical protein